jgi:hypothetical protein
MTPTAVCRAKEARGRPSRLLGKVAAWSREAIRRAAVRAGREGIAWRDANEDNGAMTDQRDHEARRRLDLFGAKRPPTFWIVVVPSFFFAISPRAFAAIGSDIVQVVSAVILASVVAFMVNIAQIDIGFGLPRTQQIAERLSDRRDQFRIQLIDLISDSLWLIAATIFTKAVCVSLGDDPGRIGGLWPACSLSWWDYWSSHVSIDSRPQFRLWWVI